jgi:hypothetical protein
MVSEEEGMKKIMVKILVLVNRDLMDYRHLLEIDERTTHQ